MKTVVVTCITIFRFFTQSVQSAEMSGCRPSNKICWDYSPPPESLHQDSFLSIVYYPHFQHESNERWTLEYRIWRICLILKISALQKYFRPLCKRASVWYDCLLLSFSIIYNRFYFSKLSFSKLSSNLLKKMIHLFLTEIDLSSNVVIVWFSANARFTTIDGCDFFFLFLLLASAIPTKVPNI